MIIGSSIVSKTTPIAPGWRTWLIWTVGVGAYTTAILNRTSLAAVGVDAALRFSADASVLSLLAVIQLAVYGVLQIPIGIMLDRFGPRVVLAIGMLLMASAQVAAALAASIEVAILARVLIGAGDAAIFPGVLRVIAAWFPAQRTPLMAQLTGVIGQLGQVVAVFPLAALIHASSWAIAFSGLAGVGLLFAVLIFVVVRDQPARNGRQHWRSSPCASNRHAAWREFKETCRNPGTRIGFWTHFTAPFGGTVFVILWGFPFLTAGEGLEPGVASTLITILVLCGVAAGPIVGALSGRFPGRRTYALVIPSVAFQLLAWVTVAVWPGPAPLWVLLILAVSLGTGGPAAIVGFDHARTLNPIERLSRATGIINGAGYFAALLAILCLGIAMDAQGAGAPGDYSLGAFRVAFCVQIPLWLIGMVAIIREQRRMDSTASVPG